MAWKIGRRKKSVNGFKIRFFKESGCRPFSDFDFEKNNVYGLSRYTLRTSGELRPLFEELLKAKGVFEMWEVPSVLNLEDSIVEYTKNIKNTDTEASRYLSYIAGKIPNDGIMTIYNSFVIVSKSDDHQVSKSLQKMGFTLVPVSEEEANRVEVSYKSNLLLEGVL